MTLAVGSGTAEATSHGAVTELTVMSYNIFMGGSGSGQPLSMTAQVIEAGGADIVGIQESEGTAAALASMLRFHHADLPASPGTGGRLSAAILSRYPITRAFTHGVQIKIPPGTDVYVFDVHLTGFPYQPYDIRDGLITTESQAIAEAATVRGGEIRDALSELGSQVPYGAPVFLVGDFNEPSHLDWTSAAADAGLHFKMKVDWPASNAVTGRGLIDAYRTMHRDEVSTHGNTWTPAPGAFGPPEQEVHDRIDFVYFGGNGIALRDVNVVGESGDQADVVVAPYPSDHRAVAATFTLAPRR